MELRSNSKMTEKSGIKMVHILSKHMAVIKNNVILFYGTNRTNFYLHTVIILSDKCIF